jgi:outer membrane immunogenic protein
LETAARKFLMATIAATLAATGASAADMATPIYAKAPVMAPAYNWSGFYVGVNGGYGWEDPTVVLIPNDPIVVGSLVPPASWTNKGGFGGGQIGYNYQFGRQWLAGLEADIDFSNLKGSGSSAVRPFQNLTSQNVDWFGTVRGRLGWLPTERLLVFATGGLAYGDVKENVSVNNTTGFAFSTLGGGYGYTCAATGPCFAGQSSSVKAGWAAGGGFEYAFWQNLTVKAEYLYADLGRSNTRVTALAGGSPTLSSYTAAFTDLSFNLVRAGINYKFGYFACPTNQPGSEPG